MFENYTIEGDYSLKQPQNAQQVVGVSHKKNSENKC